MDTSDVVFGSPSYRMSSVKRPPVLRMFCVSLSATLLDFQSSISYLEKSIIWKQ